MSSENNFMQACSRPDETEQYITELVILPLEMLSYFHLSALAVGKWQPAQSEDVSWFLSLLSILASLHMSNNPFLL